MRFAAVAVAVLVAVMPPAAVAAQRTTGGRTGPAEPAVVSGVVRSAEGRPLDGASVEVLGTRLLRTTAASGGFRFAAVPPGRYWILVRRIGYAPVRVTATLAAGDTRRIPITLERLPTRLAELPVPSEGKSRPRHQDFLARARSAAGAFITRDDLAAIPGDLVAVVQRHLPGRSRATLERRVGGAGAPPTGRLVRRGRSSVAHGGAVLPATRSLAPMSGPDCTPAISVNGRSPWPGLALTDFDRSEIEALEIYSGAGAGPADFGSLACGLVVVWTR